jgi:hypothetical protein
MGLIDWESRGKYLSLCEGQIWDSPKGLQKLKIIDS